jgi:hypothetical protein
MARRRAGQQSGSSSTRRFVPPQRGASTRPHATRRIPVIAALFTIRSDAYEPLQLAREQDGVPQEMLNLPPMPNCLTDQMNPLPQNRKTEKVVTRGAQQVAINSAIAWSEAENAVAARLRRLARISSRRRKS